MYIHNFQLNIFHIIDAVDIFQMCTYDHYMVPKII
jgi:hypothetical protein